MKSADLPALAAKFHPDDLEWRVSRSGKKNNEIWCKVLCYLSNRAIMDRLDEAAGPGNWCNLFQEWHEDYAVASQGKDVHPAQLCGISIYIEDRSAWITKWDGAEQTHVESTKGGLSDAMKRAAVQWGIGRYLYQLTETYAKVSQSRQDGWHWARLSREDGGDPFFWQVPKLPAWALPDDMAAKRVFVREDQGGETPADQDEQRRGGALRAIKTRLQSRIGAQYAKLPDFVRWLNEAVGGTFEPTADSLRGVSDEQIATADRVAGALIAAAVAPPDDEIPF